MNIRDLSSYAEIKGVITVPELQRDFGVTYREARAAVESLVTQFIVEYESGLNYRHVLYGLEGAAREAGRLAQMRKQADAIRKSRH